MVASGSEEIYILFSTFSFDLTWKCLSTCGSHAL